MAGAFGGAIGFLAGLLVMAAVYGGFVAWIPLPGLADTAMLALFATLIVAAGLLWRLARLTAARWLGVALLAAIGAAYLIGAEGALDTLHGAHRPKADVAGALGGLELWFVLCPGVVSLEIGGAANRLVAALKR